MSEGGHFINSTREYSKSLRLISDKIYHHAFLIISQSEGGVDQVFIYSLAPIKNSIKHEICFKRVSWRHWKKKRREEKRREEKKLLEGKAVKLLDVFFPAAAAG